MKRFLPFLLALLIADLAMAEGPNDQQEAGVTGIVLTPAPLIFKGLYGRRSGGTNVMSFSSHCGYSPSENAVVKSLNWLVSSQNKNGSWGTEPDAVRAETGMALIAFFGHGETPASSKYGNGIGKGFNFLLDEMRETNQISAIGYAIASWALCEGNNLTKKPPLEEGSEKTASFIISRQRPSGLWDRDFRVDGGQDDIESSYWQVLALAARMSSTNNAGPVKSCLELAATAMEKKIQESPEPGDAILLLRCLQITGRSRSSAFKEAYASITNIIPDWTQPSFKDPMARWNALQQLSFSQGRQDWIRITTIP